MSQEGPFCVRRENGGGLEWRIQDGETAGRGDPVEHWSNKNEMRPSTWAVSESVRRNFSVTLLESGSVSDARSCHFSLLHNGQPRWRKTTIGCCFHLCLLWRPCSWIVSLVWTERPVGNPVSILLLLEDPPALNNTSRHAVRDQLTLKLLDFTLKGPVPEMSSEFCRQFCLSIFRPCLEVYTSEVSMAGVMQARVKTLDCSICS